MNLPFDIDFAFGDCGFDWVPAHIDRNLLFNVSFEPATGDIKLYVLDATRTLLHKISRTGITVQRGIAHDATAPDALRDCLGHELDFNDLVLDTVEDDTYYIYLDPSSPSQYVAFLGALCARFGFTRDHLVQVANRINRRQVANLYECMLHRCISGARVPLRGGQCKLYSRPFGTGNGFDLDSAAERFLRRLYRCEAPDLEQALRHLWVSREVFSGRLVLTTQRQAMLRGRT